MKQLITRILLLVDRSSAAVPAAKYAIEMARQQKARLVAATVIDTESLRNLLRAHIFVNQEVDEYEKEMEASSMKQINYIVELARKEKVEVSSLALKGSVHAAILSHMRSAEYDFLILPGFVSSIAKRDLAAREKQLIVDETPCPVLLVR
ncbi:MAG TPA: universal stress protein [Candidatus Brocadiia bacterium]|nr:universal stress protein [Candidatus Brocadiia bacterium]